MDQLDVTTETAPEVVAGSTALQVTSTDLADRVEQIEVTDQESFEQASALRQECKGHEKVTKAVFLEPRTAAHAAWKRLVAAENDVLNPIKAMVVKLDAKVGTWQRAEQLRIAEIRRKEAEEIQRKAEEEELRQAEALAAAGVPEEAALDIAEETVSATVEAAASIATAPVQVAKTAGHSTIDKWNGECADIKAMARAVVEGKLPPSAIQASQSAMNQFAKMHKQEGVFHGIRVVKSFTQRSY